MSGAVVEMECLICGDAIKTGDVTKAIAFDREHTAMHNEPGSEQ